MKWRKKLNAGPLKWTNEKKKKTHFDQSETKLKVIKEHEVPFKMICDDIFFPSFVAAATHFRDVLLISGWVMWNNS